ncbi:MAG: HdeD family acid-resistance protein [Candidatus Promineifilaceae bacterium]
MTTESFSAGNAIWAEVKLPPWWLVLIEGILLIILGVMFFMNPYGTMVTAVWVLGIYWLVRGIIELVSLIWDRALWGWKIFSGILGIVAGWILIQQPLGGTLVLSSTLVFILGFIGIFQGIVALIEGFKGAGWGTLIIGIISIILGVILLMNVRGAAAWMPWALGIMAIISGISALFGSFRVKSMQDRLDAM